MISALIALAMNLGASAPTAKPTPFAGSAALSSTHRLALVIGSHDGGPGRERLAFAATDAQAFVRTLHDLGGLDAAHQTLLVDPDSSRLMRAFQDLRSQAAAMKKQGLRTEAIVYYSGHADEQGLLLGRERLAYRTFRDRMDGLEADVRIAIVDACASGALTRLKGGKQVPAFLVDQSTRSQGYAILTSSSESEAAQESDRVGGSYFTHALNSGLRGAADASQDGKVTLHEAYQFAYQETLARTEATQGGPQHAGYDMRLSGTGDVVLTDLRQASAYLDLTESLHGRIFVRDSADHLAVEVMKPAGRAMRLGLEPGRYGLRLFHGGKWREAEVRLKQAGSTSVDEANFRSVAGETTVLRGSARAAGSPSETENETRTGTQWAVAGAVTRGDLHGRQLSLAFNQVTGHLKGQQICLAVWNGVQGDLQGNQLTLAGINFVRGQARGNQGAVFFNVVGDSLHGSQGSVFFNVAGGKVTGSQGAALFNVAGQGLKGFQGSALFNIAGGDVLGAQGTALANLAVGKVTGGQGSALLNIAVDSVVGLQGAALLNVAAKGVTGAQGAALLNVSGGEVSGFQGAAGVNFARRLSGVQASALLNVAGHVDGYQLGVVNFSKSYGSGYPIGLLNMSLQGSFHVTAWGDETGMAYVGLRTGVKNVYSLLAVGAQTDGTRDIIAPTLGLGWRQMGPKPWFFETDLLQSQILAFKPFVDEGWTRLRLGLGARPFRHCELFGGVSGNLYVHPDKEIPAIGDGYPGFRAWGSSLSVWPGAYLGLRLGT